ncbi:MAG: EAL domain-containing protein (putative c-di-GMP-specific phosphodiesterase class I) [Gammaproteobacteria bacterium]|jgi:EAL domain-containing protein (putative c-di-GMP-specific phosphodiesterase class I)
MMAVTNIPNMIDRNAYVVRSRFISSSGVQITTAEHARLMKIDKNILLIDNWILRNSLGILLQSHKTTNDGLIFSMKLRNESIVGPHFVEWLVKLLKKQTVPKHSFMFEITSDDLLKSAKKYSGLMTYLRQTYGFEFILSGLNSLSEYNRLSKKFQFEFYKMNKTFIDAMNSSEPVMEDWEELIKKIHDSGSYVIASFIEDSTTLSNTIASGIDLVQGYFVGEPTSDVPKIDRIPQKK